ncbi:MAG: tetratricopeptide repeat protein [Thermoanaerobaculia bacterium]
MRVAIAITLLVWAAPVLRAQSSDGECRLGAYYLARGDFARALTTLDSYVSDRSSPASDLNLRGIAEMMSGQPDRAAETFALAMKKDPDSQQARFNHGLALLKSKSFAAAIPDFASVYEKASSAGLKARAAYHLALAECGLLRYDEATKWLEFAVRLDPSIDDAWLFLGVAYEHQNRFQQAGRAYRVYLDRHPDSIVAMLRFGVAALRDGAIDTAKSYLRKVVDRAPSSVESAEARKYLVMWE